jgi:GT2 family glycosyltransferase
MEAAARGGGDAPLVSAIVVNHRRPELLAECLASLDAAFEAVDADCESIVVDNASGDRSCDLVRERFPAVGLIELSRNLGFAAAVNRGLDEAAGEWILLLNNDAVIDPGGVAELLRVATSHPAIGSVAALMCFAESPEVINSAGIGVDRLGVAYDRLLGEPVRASEAEPVEVFGASGGAALHRRAMLESAGGLDASFFFALEDADLAWRARMAGWRCMYAPAARVRHRHGATGVHQSSFKHYHVGLNRVRLLAKNADGAHLRRYGVLIAAYDACYVAYTLLADRTLAPLRGRLRGLREWRAYRRAGAAHRRPVRLEPVRGLRAALRRRAAWDQTARPAPGAAIPAGRDR